MSDLCEVSEIKPDLADTDMYTWIKFCVHGTHIEAEAGELLREQFQEAVKSDDDTYIFNLRKDILYSDQELIQIREMADFLRMGRNDEIIAILNSEPYYISLSFDNINADIDRMMAMHKQKQVRLKLKEAEYVKHIERHEDVQPPTELDWYSQLRVLSKWQGHPIPAKTTSVMEYIVYLNDFKADVKRNLQSGT